MPIALPLTGADPPALPPLSDAAHIGPWAHAHAHAQPAPPRGSLALLAGALLGGLVAVLALLCWPAASLTGALGWLVLAPLSGAALAHGLVHGLHWHEVFPMC